MTKKERKPDLCLDCKEPLINEGIIQRHWRATITCYGCTNCNALWKKTVVFRECLSSLGEKLCSISDIRWKKERQKYSDWSAEKAIREF